MGKVVIITGGGRGLGAATAVEAAKRGYAVCVNYRERADRADQVVAAIKDAGGTALAVQADIAVEADILRLFETSEGEFGPVTHLVNSAGISTPYGRVDELGAADLERHFAINVFGSVLCAREAVKRMSTAHGGSGGVIVNLGSAASRLGGAGANVIYAASKSAIDAFTFGLAQEVAGEGIRVVCISPGVIDTEIQPPGRVEQMGPQLPMKRAGQPDEVAEAILWALSDAASYVSGTIIGVSGAR